MDAYQSSFAANLIERCSDIEAVNRTEVRWWMASGMHTDETIREELKAMHNAGFGGVELCQLADRTIDETIYGYGGAQWKNDVKIILNTALDLGMSVSLTSGAGWSTANVPGLNPDCQEANQCAVLLIEEISAGCTRSGPLPTSERLRPAASLIGIIAVRKLDEKLYDSDGFIELTTLVQGGNFDWTAPEDCNYTIMYYFAQGTAQAVSPAVEKSYTINYFDRRGVKALKEYLTKNVLDDEKLNEKIRAGNVQFFMDSLEYHCGAGITSWTETFREEFQKRKGYDILPYLYLAKGAPVTSIWEWSDNADLQGVYALPDGELNRKILNDIYDVQTVLYLEEFINPFREWLNTCGITLRVQISYGKNLEISQPIAYVDYPEAENRNQKNQPDMYRLWSGGAHLLNKVLSSETGGLDHSGYAYTFQQHLQEAYTLYASGYSRIIWHIWSSVYGPKPVWPGYEGGDHKEIYYKFGTREPSYSDYGEFNEHLGRIQKMLRRGRAGVDIGMLYTKYGQHLVYQNEKDWLREHETMFFPAMNLQDSGYTYDYFSPEFLSAESVYFDPVSGTLEAAGYKVIVLWQADLSLSGAQRLMELAKEGLPVIVVDGAAVRSPYLSDSAEDLEDVMASLKCLPNVKTVSSAEEVLDAVCAMNLRPYAGFVASNCHLLTQTRRDGENRIVFVYNYSHNTAETELIFDGTFVVHPINTWTGEHKTAAMCRYADGSTILPIGLVAGDATMYVLESADCVPAAASEGIVYGNPYPITEWKVIVESWSPSDEILTRSEDLLGVHTEEYAVKTERRLISTELSDLASWDKIPEIGGDISGKGYYHAEFLWDGNYDGAYLDFGRTIQSMKVCINGRKTRNLSMIHPMTDITELLLVGKNTIEIEYSSNLTNLQITRKKIREGVLPSGFPGYEVTRQSYGPKQAVIIPFSRTKQEKDTV